MPHENFCGSIISPCCPTYCKTKQIFNRSIKKSPVSISYCENEEDVRLAVRSAAKRGQTVRIRSGGHNYEGFCIGNNVAVIDVSCLKYANINIAANKIEIGSGINNSELYSLLGEHGFPFPSGTCPTVSAAGLTQGGGWGHSARMFGLACDYLTEARLVDAGGEIITANDSSHPDLFWALRGGGGGNFGVLTSLTYQLPPRFNDVTYVDIRYSRISDATAYQFFQVWQTWNQSDEIRFTPNSRIFNSEQDGMGIFLRGFFYGTPEEALTAVQPFLDIDGARADLEYMTFWQATKVDAAFYPDSESFRFAGRFARGIFTPEQIDCILSLIKNRAEGSTYASVALYAMGGRIRNIAPDETAFFYRNADYIIGIETIWENPLAEQDNLAWMSLRFQCLESLTTGSYINFPYLHTADYMNAYYGCHAGQLRQLKKLYDPHNLFCFEQSIQLY